MPEGVVLGLMWMIAVVALVERVGDLGDRALLALDEVVQVHRFAVVAHRGEPRGHALEVGAAGLVAGGEVEQIVPLEDGGPPELHRALPLLAARGGLGRGHLADGGEALGVEAVPSVRPLSSALFLTSGLLELARLEGLGGLGRLRAARRAAGVDADQRARDGHPRGVDGDEAARPLGGHAGAALAHQRLVGVVAAALARGERVAAADLLVVVLDDEERAGVVDGLAAVSLDVEVGVALHPLALGCP